MNRAIKGEDLKRTIALYVDRSGFVRPGEVKGWIEDHDDYARITEPLEVEFAPLPDEVVVDHRVKSIDKQIEKTRAELTKKIADLADQKQKLLAISHQQDVA